MTGETLQSPEVSKEQLLFTIQSPPTDGPAPENIRADWVGISFLIQENDIKLYVPKDSEKEPYQVVVIPVGTAVQKLLEEGKQQAADFWLEHTNQSNKDTTMPLYFKADCGQFFEMKPIEISMEMVDGVPHAERIYPRPNF
jgi:hypothetical protein